MPDGPRDVLYAKAPRPPSATSGGRRNDPSRPHHIRYRTPTIGIPCRVLLYLRRLIRLWLLRSPVVRWSTIVGVIRRVAPSASVLDWLDEYRQSTTAIAEESLTIDDDDATAEKEELSIGDATGAGSRHVLPAEAGGPAGRGACSQLRSCEEAGGPARSQVLATETRERDTLYGMGRAR